MTRKGVRNGLGLVFAYAGTYKPDRLLRPLHLFRHEGVAKKTLEHLKQEDETERGYLLTLHDYRTLARETAH